MRNIYCAIGFILFVCCLTQVLAEEWLVHSIDQQGRGADGVRFADANNDGLLDIVVGWEEAGESRAYLHPGLEKTREPWPKVCVGKSGGVEDAVFCDLDSDGCKW